MKSKKEAQFKASLRQAARFGLLTGKIGIGDWLKIQSVLFNSKRTAQDGTKINLIEELAEHSTSLMLAEGKVPVGATVDSIDWTAVMDWIQNNLPKILELITTLLGLFGK
jgi:hypothetical protein